MSTATIKLLILGILFFTWVGLVFAKAYDPQLETAELISAIKEAMVGLGIYHALDAPSTPPAAPDQPTDKAAP